MPQQKKSWDNFPGSYGIAGMMETSIAGHQ